MVITISGMNQSKLASELAANQNATKRRKIKESRIYCFVSQQMRL